MIFFGDELHHFTHRLLCHSLVHSEHLATNVEIWKCEKCENEGTKTQLSE